MSYLNAVALKRVKNIYSKLRHSPRFKTLGRNTEEMEMTYEINALLWVHIYEKSHSYEEADKAIESIILINSEMINAGIIGLDAELVK